VLFDEPVYIRDEAMSCCHLSRLGLSMNRVLRSFADDRQGAILTGIQCPIRVISSLSGSYQANGSFRQEADIFEVSSDAAQKPQSRRYSPPGATFELKMSR